MRNRFYLYPISLLTLFLLYNYQAVVGPAVAQIEIWRLRSNALITTKSNPPDVSDSFDNDISDLWNTKIINDQNVVNPGPKFGAGGFDVTEGRLYLRLNEDPNFNGKTYQNVALFGFKGYVPAPGRDVVARAVMQASLDFFLALRELYSSALIRSMTMALINPAHPSICLEPVSWAKSPMSLAILELCAAWL